jgi:hypothetical protein
MAMSEAVKEIRFVYYLLVSLVISVKLPIIVRTENIDDKSSWQKIPPKVFVPDILIPGTISSVSM